MVSILDQHNLKNITFLTFLMHLRMQGSLKHPILIYLIISDRTFLNCFLF